MISPYLMFVIMTGLCNAVLAASLNLVTGVTGQFSLGHAGFMAVGAYVSAYLTKVVFQIGAWNNTAAQAAAFLFCLVTGAAAAAMVAYLVGVPILRLRGDYLCIATLGFNQIVVVILNNLAVVGGPRGFTGIAKLSSAPWILGLTAVSILLIHRYVHSVFGNQCVAVREDEIAAESLGVSSSRHKTRAFVIGSFFAGLAGGMLAHLVQLAHPSQYTFLKSIEILLMVVVGGMGSIAGSVVAAIGLTLLPELLRFSQDLRLVIYPLMLIIFVSRDPSDLLKRLKPVRARVTR
ncbi:MAG: branched-chain amino acid ABC transporter permease [Ignavibacteriales bacterium]